MGISTCPVSVAGHLIRRQKTPGRNVSCLVSQESRNRISEKIKSQAKQLTEPKVPCILSEAQRLEESRMLSQP